MIHHGDCVEVMAGMEPDSIDAIVCDPPYSLGFMSKPWDMQMQHEPWATAALRVAKPGAYLLAFGGTRTVHRLTCALEDAGWIIRDTLVWAYAQGFPKSKSSLKPAWEPIVLARKPGPLRELAIDACRIGYVSDADAEGAKPASPGNPDGIYGYGGAWSGDNPPGRWPANLVLTDPILDGGWDGVVGGGDARSSGMYQRGAPGPRLGPASIPLSGGEPYGDTGTYSRFFMIPKASRSDREPKVPGGLEIGELRTLGDKGQGPLPQQTPSNGTRRRNTHPTVKPTRLMRHLIRLVTPQGGTILDPFLGSGTTAKAAVLEGVQWIGIEREAEYIAIAEQRLVGLEPEPEQISMTA